MSRAITAALVLLMVGAMVAAFALMIWSVVKDSSAPDGQTLFIRDCHRQHGTVILALDSSNDLCRLP